MEKSHIHTWIVYKVFPKSNQTNVPYSIPPYLQNFKKVIMCAPKVILHWEKNNLWLRGLGTFDTPLYRENESIPYKE